MSFHPLQPDLWHRCIGDPDLPARLDPASARGLELARHAVAEAMEHGVLVTPVEAMAVACRDDHRSETLYSLARRSAGETRGDLEIILRCLEHDYPELS